MQGDTVDFKFIFKNVGKAPLEILQAIGTCGCTRPSFPFIPIEPGEEGYIGVKYISKGKEGFQDPSINVESNGSAQSIDLIMKGFVKVPEKEEAKDSIKSNEKKKGKGSPESLLDKMVKDTITTAIDSSEQKQ